MACWTALIFRGYGSVGALCLGLTPWTRGAEQRNRRGRHMIAPIKSDVPKLALSAAEAAEALGGVSERHLTALVAKDAVPHVLAWDNACSSQ